jgi:enterochelin esterase-like enzyme
VFTVEQLGTAVEDEEVVFRLADPEHERPGVRLWTDVEIEVDDELDAERDLHEVMGGWELRLRIPPLDCLEYMFEIDGSLELDPGNPDQVDGAFGPHSLLLLPGYTPPAWLDDEPVASVRRPVRVDRTQVGRIEAQVWQPADAATSARLPLLITHDGPEMDQLGGLTHYVGAMVANGTLPPMRVALLAPGARDERYAANPAYSAALTQRVVPRLLRRFPSDHPPVLSGQSLGGVAALHAAWEAPEMFAGLLLQSSSFFTAELDPQESGYSHFEQVAGFVASVHDASEAPPGFPPVAITCGTAEENLGNNHHMAGTLSRYGVDVTWGEARQGHTWTCWRDLLDPHLTSLLQKVWR